MARDVDGTNAPLNALRLVILDISVLCMLMELRQVKDVILCLRRREKDEIGVGDCEM